MSHHWFLITEKPVFTIGTPAISDTDNFSDISLDREPSIDVTSTPLEPVGFYSPLAELDTMGNHQTPPTLNLAHDQLQVDSNLNPISAALAQLPNAASTVFSTFSSIIKGSNVQDQGSHLHEQQQQEPQVNPYGFVYSENPHVDAPPPSFFSPNDDSLFKKASIEPVNSNTFRLGGNKKKTYAHIPGLSSNPNQSLGHAAVPSVVMPPMPPQQPVQEAERHFQDYQNSFGDHQQQPIMAQTNQHQSQPAYVQKEPEKSKFSLTSLLPSQLLEKIPSTKNLFGFNDDTSSYGYQQHPENISIATNFDQPPNFSVNQSPNENEVPAQSAAPINFFNPQQFVTSPFAQSSQLKSTSQGVHGSFTAESFNAPTNVQQPPMSTFNVFPSTPLEKPPIIDQSISATNVNPPVFDQNTVPSPSANFVNNNSQPPPSFFNPVEASDFFKPNLVDDGKPKNPYSSRLSRGVGMYKVRASNDAPSEQEVVTPPMPSVSSLSQFGENTAKFTEQPKIPSRPPSISSMSSTAGSYDNQMLVSSHPPPMIIQSNFGQLDDGNIKSDSNVLNQKSIADQTSNVNFFHQPHTPLLQPQQPIKSISQLKEVVPAINFFQSEPSAPTEEPNNAFMVNCFANNENKTPQQHLEVIQTSTQETGSDINDKIDSMSENIGSTLSLFATSELDNSSFQKSTPPFESLIPKYLDTQTRESPSPAPNKAYRPVYRHWFYQNLYWHPFAMSDSLALDEAITSGKEIVFTDGGRFEVNLLEKRRSSVYWSGGSNAIRRCSWFYKNPSGSEANLLPFDEAVADFMESEFEKSMITNDWNVRKQIPETDEFFILKDSANIEFHQMGQTLIVKRGVDEFVIDDGEEAAVDHLILSVSSFGDKIDDSGKYDESRCNFSKLFFVF